VEFDDGWGLVRASNTQPVLVMRFEAQTEKRLAEIRALIENEVKKIMQEMSRLQSSEPRTKIEAG